jgi:C4-dicarboxylate-specific signal transduction histidine kinase
MVDVFIALTFPPGAGLGCISGSVIDMTERKRVQSLLERTRAELDSAIRSATIGELSASIAHDVSQPLTAIRTCTDAARRWLERVPPM